VLGDGVARGRGEALESYGKAGAMDEGREDTWTEVGTPAIRGRRLAMAGSGFGVGDVRLEQPVGVHEGRELWHGLNYPRLRRSASEDVLLRSV
jgi:hypothetical protein